MGQYEFLQREFGGEDAVLAAVVEVNAFSEERQELFFRILFAEAQGFAGNKRRDAGERGAVATRFLYECRHFYLPEKRAENLLRGDVVREEFLKNHPRAFFVPQEERFREGKGTGKLFFRGRRVKTENFFRVLLNRRKKGLSRVLFIHKKNVF